MDDLIKGLPDNATTKEYTFFVVDEWDEGNVCTTTQVKAAKAKGWTSYTPSREKYEGSDPSGINSAQLDADTDAPIYDLNGQRLSKPRKGINIIGGKKVVVK